MVARRSSASLGSPGSEGAGQTQVVVPKLNVDPVWSLQPWSAVVSIGRYEFEIPALSAVDWLAYLMQPDPDVDLIVMELLPDVDDLLIDGEIELEDVYESVLDLIATVCARSWWVALRQISVARASWNILGPQMLESVDASQVSIAAWLDILLIKMLNSMDPKETTLFTSRLEAPPAAIAATREPMEEMEMDRGAFLSMS